VSHTIEKVGYDRQVATAGMLNDIRYDRPRSSYPAQPARTIEMPKKSQGARQKKLRATAPIDPGESRASEAVTLAWTSSVTAVLMADIVVIAAHLYVRANPDASAAKAFEAIMLLSAAPMGAISIALMAVVWRTRRLKPPRGYVVFATLVATAPIIALIGRLLG
jgi:hypothetical protein